MQTGQCEWVGPRTGRRCYVLKAYRTVGTTALLYCKRHHEQLTKRLYRPDNVRELVKTTVKAVGTADLAPTAVPAPEIVVALAHERHAHERQTREPRVGTTSEAAKIATAQCRNDKPHPALAHVREPLAGTAAEPADVRKAVAEAISALEGLPSVNPSERLLDAAGCGVGTTSTGTAVNVREPLPAASLAATSEVFCMGIVFLEKIMCHYLARYGLTVAGMSQQYKKFDPENRLMCALASNTGNIIQISENDPVSSILKLCGICSFTVLKAIPRTVASLQSESRHVVMSERQVKAAGTTSSEQPRFPHLHPHAPASSGVGTTTRSRMSERHNDKHMDVLEKNAFDDFEEEYGL